ncbi:hypothetical protein [Agrobacterium fabrum]|uniref:hypothetical protein n=1 Tax=Agrobacterium fabrum TaxID=1176649 RepID=UPI0009BB3893|nr:hypothetical protein [Agrobacterium fabrum]
MFRLSAHLKAKGEEAEASFRAWLNQSGVSFLYVEQSPLNVPPPPAGENQVAGFLVGIPHAGMLAFDVKANSAYGDHLLFGVGEVDKLACSEAFFHMTVSFSCLDLDEPRRFYWVPLRALIGRHVERRGRARVLAFPIADALQVFMDEGFLDAYGLSVSSRWDFDFHDRTLPRQIQSCLMSIACDRRYIR